MTVAKKSTTRSKSRTFKNKFNQQLITFQQQQSFWLQGILHIPPLANQFKFIDYNLFLLVFSSRLAKIG